MKAAKEAYKAGNGEAALALAYRVMERSPGTAWYRRALFLSEQVFIRMDRASDADAAMLRVIAEYPELADYAVFILADYHFEKGRFTRSATLYGRLLDRYPKSSLVASAAYRRAQSLLESYA